MPAHETRLLLLGAVAMFEPVNGYQIRRELVSWRIDEWAHVNPGSIYSGLATLARQGHVVRHDLRDGGRDVAVYELTPTGREELDRLLGQALTTVDLYDAVPFHTAFGLLPLVRRSQALDHLRRRRDELVRQIDELADLQRGPHAGTPPHALAGLHLQLERGRVELVWLEATLTAIEGGDLDFLGEQWSWTPPADDPGWQMKLDRERYRALLQR